MKYTLPLLAAALALGGCTTVSHAPLSKDLSASLQGKNLARTEYPMPDFAAFTAGKAAFALLGAAAMIAEGNEIVKTHGIADPALEIGKGLSQRLAAARAMKLQDPPLATPRDGVAEIAAQGAGSDYVLDVKTINWMFNYYPTNWAAYRVSYIARLRLIDPKTKSVVAESACQTVQGNDAAPPSKDQLLAANAALLKEYLSKAASTCVDLLAKDVLQL